ncbi:hypothetical protein FS837_000847 [Tulasnella sp. UAMH 9824]|nr:hypothetical protein FS837_000847 [Tulasnella sp. UAMH 9824]
MEICHTLQPSSISSLPPEILVIILSHLVASHDRVLGRRYDDLIRATLSNSYVRQVALATPSLWTRLEITDKPVTFELAKACLNRSGSQKLDIAIRMAIRVGPKLPGVLALAEYVAGRTRDLRVQMGITEPSQWNRINEFLTRVEFPALECLELDLWDPMEIGASTRPIPLPKGAEWLHSVSLVYLRPISPSPAISRLQYLSLSLQKWPLEHLWEILSQGERLETLELRGEGKTDVVRTSLPTSNQREQGAVTPRLQCLTLSGFDSALLAYLLLKLEAPNLKEVSLVILGFKDTWSARYPWIDATAIRPIPSVSTLDISFLPRISPVVAAPIPKFLRNLFPSIEHLSLSRYTAGVLLPFWTDILEDAETLPRASCWPLLRRLILSGSDEACEWSCIEKLKIVRRFLAVRAKRSLPALEDVSLSLCSEARKNPNFDSWMGDVQRLLDKDDSAMLDDDE